MVNLRGFSTVLSFVADALAVAALPLGFIGWRFVDDGLAPQPSQFAPYVVTHSSSQGSVGWDCHRPIGVAVNLDQIAKAERLEVLDDVQAVFSLIRQNSPFDFRIVGETSFIPSALQDPGFRLAATGAPVVLFFGLANQTDLDLPGALATGGSISEVDREGTEHLVSGVVFVDVALSDMYRAGSGYMSRQGLLMHEFLHVLGLGHTQNPGSIMNPFLDRSPGELGAGDLLGLAELARAGCGSESTATEHVEDKPRAGSRTFLSNSIDDVE